MEHATPMLKQYRQIKEQYTDCVLFFRLGDFYEMFFEDAQRAAPILDLVLTSRGKDATTKIPMCGVPYHSAEGYIARLIKAGKKVAICEQVEDPAEAKGIVKRDVIRVVTAGTYLDDSHDSRFLLSLFPNGKTFGLSFVDSATGLMQTNELPLTQALEVTAKLPIYECIYPESQKEKIDAFLSHPLFKIKNIALSPFADWCFNQDIARKTLLDHFKTQTLRGFGIEELALAQSSCGALLEYLKQMNKQPLEHIDKISLYADSDYVFISPAAHYGLEMETLLTTLDQTQTPMGRRKFRSWLFHPLKNPILIKERQEAVSLLLAEKNLVPLANTPDLEKSLSRLSCGVASPKDILVCRNTLLKVPEFKESLKALAAQNPLFEITDVAKLRELLFSAINPDIPNANAEGKIISPGYNAPLDELRGVQENGRAWLRDYQTREIKRSGINSLKVGFNNVFGYYIEVTKTNLGAVPADYIRKQTIAGGERYITPELKEYEEKILTAQEKILKIESQLLEEIRQAILQESLALHRVADQIATIDVLASLAKLARRAGYCCPQVDGTSVINIQDGRHPVVENHLSGDFTPNDTLLDCDENHLTILTGPNMAGKSTYIRQTAILVIMAQMGSFIPAKAAQVGVVDKIFTRIGAHDEIAKGQSTFMVEMTEAADILNNCSPRSLIILDEIGRGTSTYDGLSLAWALAEYLQGLKIRTLFATHFHELTSLAHKLSGVKNYNVAVKEWKDKIIFLHKIVPGGTDDSYGIYVAKLAGIPDSIIKRSKKILSDLETGAQPIFPAQGKFSDEQLNLFSAPPPNPVLDELEALDVNSLTPLAALKNLAPYGGLLKTFVFHSAVTLRTCQGGVLSIFTIL